MRQGRVTPSICFLSICRLVMPNEKQKDCFFSCRGTLKGSLSFVIVLATKSIEAVQHMEIADERKWLMKTRRFPVRKECK